MCIAFCKSTITYKGYTEVNRYSAQIQGFRSIVLGVFQARQRMTVQFNARLYQDVLLGRD